MAELILCRQPIAAVPFYIDTVSWNIYSMEELCYYIATNASLLDKSFMSEDLCKWIDTQMGMHALAARLRHLIRDTSPLHIFCGTILNETGYLTAGEIRDTMDVIASLENLDQAQRNKRRADKLLTNGRLKEAVFLYRDILKRNPADSSSAAFAGNVYHNLGTCFGRLLMYHDAAVCYEKAYQLNHNETSLRAMLAAYLLDDDADMAEIQKKRYHISDTICDSVHNAIDVIRDSEACLSVDKMVENDFVRGEDAVRRRLNHLESSYVHQVV